MTSGAWRDGESGDRPPPLSRRALAWEFARRNPELRADMLNNSVDPDDPDAFARWGLRFRGRP